MSEHFLNVAITFLSLNVPRPESSVIDYDRFHQSLDLII